MARITESTVDEQAHDHDLPSSTVRLYPTRKLLRPSARRDPPPTASVPSVPGGQPGHPTRPGRPTRPTQERRVRASVRGERHAESPQNEEATVASNDMKDELTGTLRGARESLVWKLDGLGEYDVRRPLTPSGTNLLGLVKHSTATHLGYFGQVFGRSTTTIEAKIPPADGPAAEFWVTPEETRHDIVTRYREACAFADDTIAELPLDATGHVWWWRDDPVTLFHVIVHVTADTQRHAGHADILRELIDGSVGMLPGFDSLHVRDDAERRMFYERVDATAASFR